MKIDRSAAWWWIPYLAGWGVFLAVEWQPTANQFNHRSPVDWLLTADVDALVYLSFLVTAPVAWWIHCQWLSPRRWPFPNHSFGGCARPALLSALVGMTSLAASLAVGRQFDDLPPAYHDEYSYLFQARTFLAGRVSYPSHVAARLFDQMHVLNEGQFASRYFPGAGLWMAPFVAAGHPYWGHWLAGAICAVLMFWIARELAGDTAGLIAGLLTAFSPGMGLFSNLLLAHHPTLVGLGVFVLGFLRMVRTASWGWGLVSGTGLAFAMICRPMTAAGIALPFGVYLLVKCMRSMQMFRRAGGVNPRRGRAVISPALALALPLALTLASLYPYNKAITGNGWLTPYSQYTSLHTPSHVYGFNNVERGRLHQGARVIENYDKWAENLTPALAVTNVATRWEASWKWTLGLLPLTLALCAGLVLWRRLPTGAWLVLAAILSLHAVHIPYWFVGMEDHHYVFEAGPLWAVWVAVVTVEAARLWIATDHRAVCAWWASLLAAAVVMNWTISSNQPTTPKWSAPLNKGIEDVAFARRKHGRFAEIVAQRAVPVPALVLVEADPADRHIDYVANPPNLQGPVLIGHYLPDLVSVSEVKRLFPERKLFLYRVRQDQWRSLD